MACLRLLASYRQSRAGLLPTPRGEGLADLGGQEPEFKGDIGGAEGDQPVARSDVQHRVARAQRSAIEHLVAHGIERLTHSFLLS